MSKKFFTLVICALQVAAMNSWVQGQNVDQAEWPDEAPFVAPYPVMQSNGAKAIAALKHVGAAETRYFQFISVGTKGEPSSQGTLALTMVWKKDAGGTSGHYELALENVTNVNDEMGQTDSRVRLERTLWEVRAKRYPNSPVLYYTLINKASQLPLQLSKTGFDPVTKLGSIKIVNGSTDWLWADGAKAADSDVSKVERDAGPVLRNAIRAAINNTDMIYLVQGENKSDVQVKVQNSNEPVPDNAIVFEGWEANPIILTAKHLNAELGHEDVRTQNKGKKNSFRFTFSPDVEGVGVTNVMTSYDFFAEDAKKPVRPATRLMGMFVFVFGKMQTN